jgi:predicted exporter
LVAVPGLGRLRLDTDLRAIRPTERATVAAEEAVAEAFAMGFDTATVLAEGSSSDEAFAAGRRASAALRSTLGPNATVESPSDWTLGSGEKARRLALLGALPLGAAADRLEVELSRAGLQPKAFGPGLRALRELGEGRDPAPPPEGSLPDFVRESVHLRPDGSAILAIHVRFASAGSVATSIEAVLESAGLSARVASTRAVAAELGRLAAQDVRRLGSFAAVAVCGLIWLSFRGRWGPAWRSLVPVASASAVTLGGWGLLGLRLDLLSVAVLPILLGIGVDDGLHVVHGAEGAGGDGDLGGAARVAGRAMVITTATNAAGFASLLWSSIPSLRRAGVLLAIGIVVCLLATITLLPALGALRRPRGAGADGGAR